MDKNVKYIRVFKHHPNAEIPYQEDKNTDVGYAITLIGRTDNRAEDDIGEVNYFSTGIEINPPDGCYLELAADPSLHKSGYMLATGTTALDRDSQGELEIPLYKFKDTEDIDLPFKGAQVIVRPLIPAFIFKEEAAQTRDPYEKSIYNPDFSQSQMAGDPRRVGGQQNMKEYRKQVKSHKKGSKRPHAAPKNHFY